MVSRQCLFVMIIAHNDIARLKLFYFTFLSIAKELVEGLMKVDPAHRLTSKEIVSHPWIKVMVYDGS